MSKKEFSKFFIASLKRTAQNVSPLVRKKQKLVEEIGERQLELESIQTQLEAYEAPIKEVTGGFGTEDLVERVVEVTDKKGKDGNPVKVTKWVLKFPETIIPDLTDLPDNAPLYQSETEENTENTENLKGI